MLKYVCTTVVKIPKSRQITLYRSLNNLLDCNTLDTGPSLTVKTRQAIMNTSRSEFREYPREIILQTFHGYYAVKRHTIKLFPSRLALFFPLLKGLNGKIIRIVWDQTFPQIIMTRWHPILIWWLKSLHYLDCLAFISVLHSYRIISLW